MNAKQSLRLAAKHIEELEDYNRRAAADIKAYNQCIDSMIAGGNPCEWCEDQEECQRECKGRGCEEWWLVDLDRRVTHEETIDQPADTPDVVAGAMPE